MLQGTGNGMRVSWSKAQVVSISFFAAVSKSSFRNFSHFQTSSKLVGSWQWQLAATSCEAVMKNGLLADFHYPFSDMTLIPNLTPKHRSATTHAIPQCNVQKTLRNTFPFYKIRHGDVGT
mmetsp:Transcript_30228/g.78127  ORF Transcript_30228/g.78127 Transcript_30228/m.78127 type:complete len:120 (+) Transcript_30228:332-691(+)